MSLGKLTLHLQPFYLSSIVHGHGQWTPWTHIHSWLNEGRHPSLALLSLSLGLLPYSFPIPSAILHNALSPFLWPFSLSTCLLGSCNLSLSHQAHWPHCPVQRSPRNCPQEEERKPTSHSPPFPPVCCSGLFLATSNHFPVSSCLIPCHYRVCPPAG